MLRFILYFLAVVAASILTLSVNGCAWTQDERDFYGRGWVNPRDLDRPAPYRGVQPVVGEGAPDGTPTSPWAGSDSSINRQ